MMILTRSRLPMRKSSRPYSSALVKCWALCLIVSASILSGCSASVPLSSVELPPLPRTARNSSVTPWFKGKPSQQDMEAKLVQMRRNELRLARALHNVNSEWYPRVRKLYYGKGK